jgi:5'-methylthioadenosine phosphorylase
MTEDPIRIGVIGGSGLYQMPGLTDVEERKIDTPFGSPSDSLIIGTLDGVRVAFVPRHGRGHVLMPTEVPYCANIYALKSLGVEQVVGVSACGSLREDYRPGDIVVPDQLYDNTKDDHRRRTFFGEGLVAHASVADPFCGALSEVVAKSVEQAGGTVHRGGAFITIEGPRFSTKVESNIYRAWGLSIIGMTTSPEAFLAREAEMCFAVMAHVTDYDVWHESEEPVTVEMVVQTFGKNLELAQQALRLVVPMLASAERTCDCASAMAGAVITDRRKIPPETRARLELLVGKYLD